jgi:hypothetical protein
MKQKIQPGHVLTAVTVSIVGVYSPLMIVIQISSEDEKHEGQNGRQNGSTLRKSVNSYFITVISN